MSVGIVFGCDCYPWLCWNAFICHILDILSYGTDVRIVFSWLLYVLLLNCTISIDSNTLINKLYSFTIFSLLINAVIKLLNCLINPVLLLNSFVLILYVYIHFLSLRHNFLSIYIVFIYLFFILFIYFVFVFFCFFFLGGGGGVYGGRVVTLLPPTSEIGVRFPAWPQVGKLVVACCWSAVQNTEYWPTVCTGILCP